MHVVSLHPMAVLEKTDLEPQMAFQEELNEELNDQFNEEQVNEEQVLELDNQSQDSPPGVERRAARRHSGERTSRSSSRDQGSLRIRLSDNELRAAQVVQDRFQLRSTVAVLGFSLRAMAQMIEQKQLSEQDLSALLPHRNTSSRHDGGEQVKNRTPKVRPNPLARPAKPQSKALKDHLETNMASEVDPDLEAQLMAEALSPEEA